MDALVTISQIVSSTELALTKSMVEAGEAPTQSYRNYSIQPERAASFGGTIPSALEVVE